MDYHIIVDETGNKVGSFAIPEDRDICLKTIQEAYPTTIFITKDEE